MAAAATDYFAMFSNEPMVNAPFAARCDRWENGFSRPDAHCSPKGLVIKHPAPRVPRQTSKLASLQLPALLRQPG